MGVKMVIKKGFQQWVPWKRWTIISVLSGVSVCCFYWIVGGGGVQSFEFVFRGEGLSFSFVQTEEVKLNIKSDFLIAVHAGIGALIIALYVAVVQLSSNEGFLDHRAALFFKTKLHSLTIVEVLFLPLSLFFINTGGEIKWPLVFLLFFIAFDVVSQVVIIANQSSSSAYKDKIYSAFLEYKMSGSFAKSLGKRRQSNKFYRDVSELESIKGIKVFHTQPFTSGYLPITVDVEGVVVGIDKVLFGEMLDLILNLATEDDVTDAIGIAAESGHEEVEIFFPVFYEMELKEGRPVLFLPEELGGFDKKEFVNLLRGCLEIEKGVKEGGEVEEYNRELVNIEVFILEAIKNKHLKLLQSGIDIYFQTAKRELEYFQKEGALLATKDQAVQEYNSFLRDTLSRARSRISDEVRSIFDVAMETGWIPAVKEVGYLPIRLLGLGLDFRDFYTLKSYSYFPAFMYAEAVRDGVAKELKVFLVDRSWRYLKELVDYTLLPKFRYEGGGVEEEDIVFYRDFFIEVVKTFQFLMKRSFKEYELESFRVFLSKVSSLLREEVSEYSLSVVKEELSSEVGEDKKRQLKNRVEKMEALISIKKAIEDMLFGFTAWVLQKSKIDIEARPYLLELEKNLPTKVVRLSEILTDLLDGGGKDWGWDSWDIIPDTGMGQLIPTFDNLRELFCFKLLKIFHKDVVEEGYVEKMAQLGVTWRHLAAKEGLIKIIEKMSIDGDLWEELGVEGLDGSKVAVEEVLERVLIERKRIDVEYVKSAAISDDKIEEFKKDFLKTMESVLSVNDVFENIGIYNGKLEKPKRLPRRFGINEVLNKDSFIEENVVHRVGLSSYYARSVVVGKNTRIIQKLIGNSACIKPEELNEKVKGISGEKVFITDQAGIYRFFRKQPSFVFSGKNKEHVFRGTFKLGREKIKVFEVDFISEQGVVLLLDTAKINEFSQCNPVKTGTEELLGDSSFKLEAFSDSKRLRNSFLNKPPEWLREKGDRQVQEDFLLGSVTLRILQSYRFKLSKKAGYYFYS
ncbi:hypothetical protein JKY72_06130 [Candidatus Gracilibacteria bacterium]|nr:hypothetical protein [Candidatus Gracilibacteria bacterium]